MSIVAASVHPQAASAAERFALGRIRERVSGNAGNSRRMRSRRAFPPWLAAALLVLSLSACKGGRERAASPDTRVYTVRGQVLQVPAAERPGTELFIQHEAIPDFVDGKGDTVGMESMAMPFTPAPGLSLDSIRPGDKIRFELSVDWPDNRIEVTRISRLPSDARLDFEADSASPGSGSASPPRPVSP
jgi:hypothetical protein